MPKPIIRVKNITKTYQNGQVAALKNVSLDIHEGEILALLGPNGAGKTTLISIICGLVNSTSGQVSVAGFDNVKEFRQARKQIGLVPQELTLSAFEPVISAVNFSRGLFGKSPDPVYIDKLLKSLSLSEKKHSEIRLLSGGMKRRVLIAKALAHEPKILFLDEPSAGVDVELRTEMWKLVEELRRSGVTIILTTHYIEEAEEISDRVGIINSGELVLIEEKNSLMEKLGKQELLIELSHPIEQLPPAFEKFDIHLMEGGKCLKYIYNNKGSENNNINDLITHLSNASLTVADIKSVESSLEEIFVNLVKR